MFGDEAGMKLGVAFLAACLYAELLFMWDVLISLGMMVALSIWCDVVRQFCGGVGNLFWVKQAAQQELGV